jgi:predicted Rossmann fold nucleotide-binding protein DprA/Smf involved in DNA uptake
VSEAARLSEEERLHWLQLIRNDNVVAARLPRAPLDQFGSAVALAALPGFARCGPRRARGVAADARRPSNGWRRTWQPSRYHRQPRSPTNGERPRIVALLGPIPVSIDGCALPLLSCGQVLLELEVAGRLCRHGGGLVRSEQL